MASIGDLNGDGIDDLAISARSDNATGQANDGSVYILYMNPDGSVLAPSPFNINDTTLPAGTPSLTDDCFGVALAWLGD